MARTKRQPVQRESSSEYFNKKTATWEETRENGKAASNGHAANGASKANGKLADAMLDVEKKDSAGLLQLVIAVVGIYASLYVDVPSLHGGGPGREGGVLTLPCPA
jgi:UDP-galactose transporter B1